MQHPHHTRKQPVTAPVKPALEPTIFVIFGVTGDLASKRLLPALYHLMKDDLLHEHTEIVGISRKRIDTEELLKRVELCVLESDKACDPAALERFRQSLQMVQFDPIDRSDYERLLAVLNSIEDEHGCCMNRLFYLAVPPHVYGPVVENFGLVGLNKGCQHHRAVSRLLVEKPFGYDLTSAELLISSTAHFFNESQVFRIDHYLAKETVQNILYFRTHNPAFASLWDHQYASAIEITMTEQDDVAGRENFYDNVGALRDVIQNHLLQLLALTAMELPANAHESNSLHANKARLLESVVPVGMHMPLAWRAQYAGYRDEVGNPESMTETYAKVQVSINNARWQGVPVTISAGKALAEKKTTIVLTFASSTMPGKANSLTFRVQPNEGIDIELRVKRPGYDDKTEIVHMDFSYRGALGDAEHPDAYERVLVDAVRGDHSLFATSREILASWRILQPVLTAWQRNDTDMQSYAKGSDGPVLT